MKVKQILVLLAAFIFSVSANAQKQAIIIDHSCCKIDLIPDKWITTVKTNLRIAYGHTSHGSQLVTGMGLLKSKPNSIYNFNSGSGSLYLNDASLLPGDLGNPDRTTWAAKTRAALTNNTNNINTIMWSWCGQVDANESDITNYLNLMSQLEKDFPLVNFVYMTGHLNGTGVNGNVNKRNEQIRKFCRENGKVLFDFADIESYDPDGIYFLDKNADDGCNYSGGNWATEWCTRNPSLCNSSCSCAHSHCLNCQQKGRAFWWMAARIAGWEGEIEAEVKSIDENSFAIFPNPATDHLNISLPVETNGLKLEFYNLFGENIINSVEVQNDGNNNFQVDFGKISAGIYYCLVNLNGSRIIRKFSLIK